MGAGEPEPTRPGEERPDPEVAVARDEADALATELRRRADVVTEILLPAVTLLARCAPDPARQLLRDLEDLARRHPLAPGVERLVGAVAAEIEGG